MKKIQIIITIVFLSAVVHAQSIKTYIGDKKIEIDRQGAGTINGKETYQYYVGDDGSYIKSGTYSLSGTAKNTSYGSGDGNVTSSYSVSATFKDGFLNGKLTAKMSVKGYMSYTRFTKTDYDVEVTLSCAFKDGVPDGHWVYTERGEVMDNDNKTIHKTTFNCKDGYFVGDFDIDFARSYLMDVTKQKGHFDQNGNLLSLIMRGVGSKDKGTKEFTFSPDRQLLSYVHRGLNNESKGYYKFDQELLKQNPRDSLLWIASMKQNGYAIFDNGKSVKTNVRYDRDFSRKNNLGDDGFYGKDFFSTYEVINYIYSSLMLKQIVGGIKKSDGLFSRYEINVNIGLEKVPVKPLSEAQLWGIIENIQSDLNSDYIRKYVNMNQSSVFIKCKENYQIYEYKGMEFIKLNDTVRYFNDSQSVFLKESFSQIWEELIEKKKREKEQRLQKAKNEISNSVKAKITEIMDEVVAWPMDAYKEQYPTSGSNYFNTLLVDYYNNHIEKMNIWKDFKSQKYWQTTEVISEVMKKFEKFHKVVFYNINDVHVSNDFNNCLVSLVIYKKNNGMYGYQSYKSEALFSISNRVWIQLDTQNSFEKSEKVNNIWDTIYNLIDTSSKLNNQLQLVKKTFKDVYKSYSASKNPLKGDMENSQVQYDYWQNTIANQKNYLKFIGLVKEIDNISDKIALKAKDENDIAKSYQKARKIWSLDINGIITDEVKRLENYRDVQDSCLSFIELRKTITQNNTKIAGFSKTAPTIVKAYNTHMKEIDLSWNQESSRNQAIREIISTQDALLKALSQPNISEIDKTVKKSKAKSWEDVKKIVLLH